jgi:hypothetical protein
MQRPLLIRIERSPSAKPVRDYEAATGFEQSTSLG